MKGKSKMYKKVTIFREISLDRAKATLYNIFDNSDMPMRSIYIVENDKTVKLVIHREGTK